MMKKILAIGCGGAGMFSLIVPAQLKKGQFETTVLSDEVDIYCRCSTPYTLTGEAKLKDAIQPESMFTEYGFDIVHERAVKIDVKKKLVITDHGSALKYDYLVISTGASPFRPKVKGINNDNVFTVRTSEDAENINKLAKKGKSAMVVGAGVIGIEMAGALRSKGVNVTLVESGVYLSTNIADQEFAEKIVGNLTGNGVDVLFGVELQEIVKNKIGKSEVVYKIAGKKQKLSVDFVVVAAGVRPNLDLIAGTGIEATRNGILVDKKMRTNIRNIFACGDCCVPISAVTGDNVSSSLASSAIQQAKIVGFQISGYPISYAGSTGAFAFKTLDREYAGVGMTEIVARKRYKIVVTGKAETTDVYRDMQDKKPLFVKLIFAGPFLRLVGYEAFGSGVIASAEVASFAVGLRLNIIKMLRFNYIAHPSLTPWPFMNPIIMATEDAMGNVMKKLKSIWPF